MNILSYDTYGLELIGTYPRMPKRDEDERIDCVTACFSLSSPLLSTPSALLVRGPPGTEASIMFVYIFPFSPKGNTCLAVLLEVPSTPESIER